MSRPITYICVVSEFNLPELEACLTVQPSDVVLVTSQLDSIQKSGKRLARVLQEKLPDVNVHRPDRETSSHFDGNDLRQIQAWVQQTLQPYLAEHTPSTNRRIFNFTGGTKAISMVMSTLLQDCELLHYKAVNRDDLQEFQRSRDSGDFMDVQTIPLNTTDLDPLSIARLYATHVSKSGGYDGDPAITLPLAQRMWDALEQDDPGLLQLFAGLDRIWTQEKQFRDKRLQMPLSEFLQGETVNPGLHEWVERFAKLAPDYFGLKADHLILPGNKRNKVKGLRKWISGEWLEELVEHWLISGGLSKQHNIARGIVGGDEATSSESSRETDLFVHYKGCSYIIEVKADQPPMQHAERHIDHQIASLGHRFGRTTKILLLGPQAHKHHARNNTLDAFRLRLKANQIRLCTDRDMLWEALGIKHNA